MSGMEVPYSWPIALHPDARPVPRSQHVVDVALDENAIRLESERPGLPAVVQRLMREQTLGDIVRANEALGFLDTETATVLGTLGRAGFLRRICPPLFNVEELRDFERELGALARFETKERTRFEMFARVRTAHVLVIGCGLAGAHLVQHLVSAGVGHVTLVDPAPVAPSHAGRHPYFRRSDVGRPKVEAIADQITGGHTKVCARAEAIESEVMLENMLVELGPISACVYTVDRNNLALGIWAARRARARQFALLRMNRIVVGPMYRPETNDACPGCVAPRLERGVKELGTVLSLCGEARDETAYLWPCELAEYGALAAQELFTLFTGAGELQTIDRQLAPGLGGAYREIKPFPRDETCPACGSGGAPC